MSGPTPKPSALRQRQNKVSTRATLSSEGERRRVPATPKEWHPMTKTWWRDVWHSPMAAEFVEADKHGLYRLAVMVNGFWEQPSKELHAEIRLGQQAFGLTPIDRRRLQWEVEKVESARRKPKRERREKAQSDPRETYLRAVK